jgi:hypothetical protein
VDVIKQLRGELILICAKAQTTKWISGLREVKI